MVAWDVCVTLPDNPYPMILLTADSPLKVSEVIRYLLAAGFHGELVIRRIKVAEPRPEQPGPWPEEVT